MTERWRQIPGWPYSVSSLGRVRNDRTGRMRKPVPHKSGYLNVQLHRGGELKTFMVHRLVLTAFRGPAPDGLEGAHCDGNSHDNRLRNLRWKTPAENMADRDRHGGTARGDRNGKTRYSDRQVVTARAVRVRLGRSVWFASTASGIPYGYLTNILCGVRRATN